MVPLPWSVKLSPKPFSLCCFILRIIASTLGSNLCKSKPVSSLFAVFSFLHHRVSSIYLLAGTVLSFVIAFLAKNRT